MEGEAVRRRLQQKHPQWRIWRNGDMAYAWLLKVSPPPVLRDVRYDRLGARIGLYEKTWERTGRYRESMAAAETLDAVLERRKAGAGAKDIAARLGLFTEAVEAALEALET